jgi:hypothetical protein
MPNVGQETWSVPLTRPTLSAEAAVGTETPSL